jgi:ATP-dependent Clp protease protease subunit
VNFNKLTLPTAIVLAALIVTIGIGLIGFAISRTSPVDIADTDFVVETILERFFLEGVLSPSVDYDDPLISQERMLFLVSDMDAAAANRLIRSIAYLDALSPGEPITIYIDTEGGTHGIAVANFIQTLRSPVNTIALDWAVSAGAYVLASGTGERLALPTSTIMIHSFPGENGKYSDEEFSEQDTWNATKAAFWTRHSRVPEGFYLVDRETEFFLTAAQALEFGIIDRIIDRDRVLSVDDGVGIELAE